MAARQARKGIYLMPTFDMTGLTTYLVGGAVRDALLGRAAGDNDYVVVGATVQDMLARGFTQVGRDFPVFLHPDTGEEYALARTERKSGRGYTGFVVHADPDVTLEDDLRRRDFTINAIARGADGRLTDPFSGVADIHNRVLRHVSEAFVEDPLRVLRAARFMARFAPLGFTIADETMTLMQHMAASGELSALTPERVWQELARALASDAPSAFLQTLRQANALRVVLPEVDALYGVPQRAEYHPEVDTGIHTELVLGMCATLAPRDALVAFLGLTHDLGKALTPPDEWPRHHQHERRGVEPIRTLCKRLRVPSEYAALAEIMSREHLNVHRMFELKPATVHDLLQRMDAWRKPDRVGTIATACEADKRGRTGLQDVPYPQAQRLRQAHATALPVSAKQFAQQGLQGAAVGEALRRARIAAIAEHS